MRLLDIEGLIGSFKGVLKTAIALLAILSNHLVVFNTSPIHI